MRSFLDERRAAARQENKQREHDEHARHSLLETGRRVAADGDFTRAVTSKYQGSEIIRGIEDNPITEVEVTDMTEHRIAFRLGIVNLLLRNTADDIENARTVVVGGAGLGSMENFGQVRQLAAAIGGQVAATTQLRPSHP